MKADLILKNIGTLMSPIAQNKPLHGKTMDQSLLFENAFLAVKDQKFIDFGEHAYEHLIDEHTKVVDANGRLVTPGLIDSHTHLVHAGSREHEFEMKKRGVPYIEILKAGGGIHSSVKMTQAASAEMLYEQSKQSLDRMLALGVTTVEGKSGYGLNEATELKQLRVQKQLHEKHPIDIISTYMGAHAIPPEHKENPKPFLDAMIAIMPKVKAENLAEFVDIFCEDGAFSVEESRHYLEAAKKLGFKLKIHADEIVALGGTVLAKELGAVSADHLMAINEAGLSALSESNVIANLLPSTSFNLGSPYAPARKMIDQNLAVALSSDYNPGSSPSENFQFTLNLAAIHMKMTPTEILAAATINGAWSINRAHKVGLIHKDYQADFIIWNATNFAYVLYHFATNHVQHVFKNGTQVIKNQQHIWR